MAFNRTFFFERTHRERVTCTEMTIKTFIFCAKDMEKIGVFAYRQTFGEKICSTHIYRDHKQSMLNGKHFGIS